MKYGETIEFDVVRLDHKGRGCGVFHDAERYGEEGRTACAHNAVPGERVRGTFIGKKKGVFRVGEIEVVKASPDRVEQPCPHAKVCGGCSLQHVAYARQAEIKLESLNRTLGYRKLGVKADRIVPSEVTYRHRNRMDYAFGPDLELGLKEAGRWDRYVDLETCLMLSEDAVEVMRRVKAWARSTKQEPWDNRRHEGFLRYLVIREGKNTSDRLAMLVTADGELEGETELVEALSPLCTSVYHGTNRSVTDLSFAESIRLLHGKPHLEEKVGGVAYAIHPNGFFQTNTRMAGVLLEHVRELVASGPHDKLLDLYCGVGFFGIALAGDVKEMLGVELDEDAIAMARLNAERNGAKNARFRAEAAEELSWHTERPDVVIVDPPRSGLHPKVVRTLLEHLPPRIVYVSCNPVALAKDLEAFLERYDVASCRAFDLFPQTPHVETAVHLIRKPNP